MPSVELANGLQSLLTTAFGPSSTYTGTKLQHIDIDYPRLSDSIGKGHYPRCVIWAHGHGPEQALGGGDATNPVGQKEITWEMMIHVWQPLDEPTTQGLAFRQLIDDIESLIRKNPSLQNLANGTKSKVQSAHRIRRLTPQPVDQLQNVYNSIITIDLIEWVWG